MCVAAVPLVAVGSAVLPLITAAIPPLPGVGAGGGGGGGGQGQPQQNQQNNNQNNNDQSESPDAEQNPNNDISSQDTGQNPTNDIQSLEEFMELTGTTYSSPAEQAMRLEIFTQNLGIINVSLYRTIIDRCN